MQVTISLWGNSLGLRLPQKIVKSTGIVKGDTVELELDGDAITIRKKRAKKTFKQLLSEEAKPYDGEWVDWGRPEGDEVW